MLSHASLLAFVLLGFSVVSCRAQGCTLTSCHGRQCLHAVFDLTLQKNGGIETCVRIPGIPGVLGSK